MRFNEVQNGGVEMKGNFGNLTKNYAVFRNDLPDELLESLKLRGIVCDGKK